MIAVYFIVLFLMNLYNIHYFLECRRRGFPSSSLTLIGWGVKFIMGILKGIHLKVMLIKMVSEKVHWFAIEFGENSGIIIFLQI